jgi:hypothetical protein
MDLFFLQVRQLAMHETNRHTSGPYEIRYSIKISPFGKSLSFNSGSLELCIYPYPEFSASHDDIIADKTYHICCTDDEIGL